jgi:hypothetical protein
VGGAECSSHAAPSTGPDRMGVSFGMPIEHDQRIRSMSGICLR